MDFEGSRNLIQKLRRKEDENNHYIATVKANGTPTEIEIDTGSPYTMSLNEIKNKDGKKETKR